MSPVPATFLLLLFPDGHLPSRRWRPVAWCAGVAIVGLFVTGATWSEPEPDYPTVRNPFAIDNPLMEPLSLVSQVLIFVAILCSAASVVARFRSAGRVQRQQIKWLATAGAVLAVAAPLDVVLASQFGGGAFVASTLAAVGLPAAIGIAILRHRLYDIDVVINRTLVYGALTATLVVTYLGRRSAAPTAALTADSEQQPRDRGFDARRRGDLPAGPAAHPGGGRPSLLPPQVRRRPHARVLRRALARRGRPRRPRP